MEKSAVNNEHTNVANSDSSNQEKENKNVFANGKISL